MKILAAAERVFAEKGLNGARTREIAEAADVTPSLINYHFGGKENLYKTVIESFYLSMVQHFLPIMVEDIPPPEKLRKLIAVGIDIIAEKDHVSRILLREFVDNGKYANEVLSKYYLREITSKAEEYVFSNLESKIDNRSETMHLIASIIGCMSIYFISGPIIKEIWRMDIFSKKMIEERKEEVIDLIFNGIEHRFR